MDRLKRFLKKYYKIALLTVLSPIGIGLILNIPTGNLTIGDEASWVGFFGNYAGGVIGGIVAYIVVNQQFKNDLLLLKEDKRKQQLPYLSFIKFEIEKIDTLMKQLRDSLKLYGDDQFYYYPIDERLDVLKDNIIPLINIPLQTKLIQLYGQLERIYRYIPIELYQMELNKEKLNSQLKMLLASGKEKQELAELRKDIRNEQNNILLLQQEKRKLIDLILSSSFIDQLSELKTDIVNEIDNISSDKV
ncbi:hypothetical protein D3P08_00090 [Paenibacillus nanensis]|uniref:Uncharacterized protein n=1 Tax=Paenibacillus nanensis TaxID=393251 RepID=A0A3A1VHX4_9BACL|nr:hypothetical protein [Paenibacillus nanensis]RIX60031.1 hypothetical protein D3P08_00090 [Paenibacillus nanensis]